MESHNRQRSEGTRYIEDEEGDICSQPYSASNIVTTNEVFLPSVFSYLFSPMLITGFADRVYLKRRFRKFPSSFIFLLISSWKLLFLVFKYLHWFRFLFFFCYFLLSLFYDIASCVTFSLYLCFNIFISCFCFYFVCFRFVFLGSFCIIFLKLLILFMPYLFLFVSVLWISFMFYVFCILYLVFCFFFLFLFFALFL